MQRTRGGENKEKEERNCKGIKEEEIDAKGDAERKYSRDAKQPQKIKRAGERQSELIKKSRERRDREILNKSGDLQGTPAWPVR